jgi:hypothetical protein
VSERAWALSQSHRCGQTSRKASSCNVRKCLGYISERL